MRVKVRQEGGFELPKYESAGAAGMDLRASAGVVVFPGNTMVVPTGLYLEIPEGYEGQVRSRSGLAAKHGVFVLNSPGTIDADYRGEVKVILHNSSGAPFRVVAGDRVAQLVFAKVERAELEVGELAETARGDGGLGSTGVA